MTGRCCWLTLKWPSSERIDWLECSGQRCAVIDASFAVATTVTTTTALGALGIVADEDTGVEIGTKIEIGRGRRRRMRMRIRR